MAEQKIAEEHPESLKHKTWVLRVSVHCEGCKKRVKKILSQVEGVYAADIDIKQQKVTVTGNVEADALIKKLVKCGKSAQLWPQQQPTQKEKKPPPAKPYKNKDIKQPVQVLKHESSSSSSLSSSATQLSHNADGDVNKQRITPAAVKIEDVQEANEEKKNDSVGDYNGSIVKGSEASENGGGDQVSKPDEERLKLSGNEAKTERKKPETGSSGGKSPCPPLEEAEKKCGNVEADGGGVVEKSIGFENSGTSKKKKKKGQDGNLTSSSSPSGVPASRGSQIHVVGPPHALMPINDGPPRHKGYMTTHRVRHIITHHLLYTV